jgi:hypothetical protein
MPIPDTWPDICESCPLKETPDQSLRGPVFYPQNVPLILVDTAGVKVSRGARNWFEKNFFNPLPTLSPEASLALRGCVKTIVEENCSRWGFTTDGLDDDGKTIDLSGILIRKGE